MSSLIAYTTQIGPFPDPTQRSQASAKIFLVYVDKMTQKQTDLMKDARILLEEILNIGIVTVSEVTILPRQTRFFVIPYRHDSIIKLIRSHAEKPTIFTAKCVIEARKYHDMALPARKLAISVSMYGCRIFLARAYDLPELRDKINEMCGTILGDFNDPKLNVVVIDRANDRYCAKARARNVAVVSRDWVDDMYSMSKSEEDHMNHNALSSLAAYQIKPFLGLKFRILMTQLGRELRDLISNNGGKLVFGANEETTHVVATSYSDETTVKNKPRVVDVEFLRVCNQLGYYMNKKEYRSYRESIDSVTVKQEPLSLTQSMTHQNDSLQYADCATPPQQNPNSTMSSIQSNGYDRISENQSMPPPSLPRQSRQSNTAMDNLILKALSSFENGTQTQMASTQIRRMPETEIRIERPTESSQQLFWSK